VTLDEWIELSPAERNERRRHWLYDPEGLALRKQELAVGRHAAEWSDLLSNACILFKAKFGSHPLINHIGQSVQIRSQEEPSIIVTTGLHTPQLIEEVPDRFCTFPGCAAPHFG
jgi:hypothetical protein